MRPVALARDLLLRARLAGRAAEGVVGQGRQRGGSAARIQPPRDDERPRYSRPMEGRSRAEGGVSSSPASRGRASPPQLYLVTPRLAETVALAREIGDAIDAGKVAAVLVRLEPSDERTLTNRLKAITDAVQRRDAALLVDGYPEIVARSGADGAHLTGMLALTAALDTLKPDRIAGAGGLHSRHDAMLAGEAGADYVMF